MISLQEMLSYHHPQVIRRFKKELPDHAHLAEEVFQDLMRFFWASRKHEMEKAQHPQKEELDFIYIMDEEMRLIDQMWHIFLLYTQDYMDFCLKFFGEYLHHLPDIVDEMKESEEVMSFEANLEKFLSFTYDQLGEETIRRWYAAHLTD
jgi:hypothetical protein